MPSLSARQPNTAAGNLTSFVGRRNDLAAVRQLFSVTRLVTVSGIGGVGKTRLALQVANDLQRAFPDGVFLVELAALRDPSLLPHTVMEALEERQGGRGGALTVLSDFLHQRHLLLILDNCEHMVDAVAELVDHILRIAPNVSILATSRQSLRIDGEHLYPLGPLLVPDPTAPLSPGSATNYPAVALFSDRAAAVVPGFTVNAENEAAVVRLCHRLEGIPLAIELAAIRLRVLPANDLANGLDDRFALLGEGNRNVPERHRTLQAVVDWSYDLCTTQEQLLWARSSVFAGDFSAEALETVCVDEQLPPSVVLDTIGHLVDKSILIREEHGAQVRFRTLETISTYGRARLAERGEEDLFARRHRDWYADLLVRAEAEWATGRQLTWAMRLLSEYANIRAALEFCVSTEGEARAGMAMAAVPWFWGAMNHMDEARLWLGRTLALDDTACHERAWALATSAYTACFQGDSATIDDELNAAETLAVKLSDQPAVAFVLHVRGFRQSLLDAEAAVPLFAEAMEQYQRVEIAPQYAESLAAEMAANFIFISKLDEATEIANNLYERTSAAGERWNLSYALWLRGVLALARGDATVAEGELSEALRIKLPFRDTLGMALTLEVLAWTAALKGESDRAATLLGATDGLWTVIGARQLRHQRAYYEAKTLKQSDRARFDLAYQRGERLKHDEAIAFALRESQQVAAPSQAEDNAVKLSKRELEVARLVADGMSNKEIAAKLVVSLRTAEGHVESILSKLGFRSRTQIAGWLADRQGSVN